MSYMTAGGVMGRGTRSNIVFPNTPPASEGVYEPQVLGLDPAIYLKFGSNFSDSSGSGRPGSAGGSGGSFVAALAAQVGTGNLAYDTEGTAFVSIPHAAADVALTVPSNWESEQSTDGYRIVADATISIWFEANALPTGSDKAVIVAKSVNQTPGVAASYDGSFEAYLDANGALHVEVRSFRGRPCRIRTPDGAVTVGATKHLVVQLSYDGVAAWLNGAKLEDGYANLLHVFGLSANIRGTTHANTNAWTIGKAAWGGQADIIVDEFAVFLRAPSATISQANVNTLAQQSSTPSPLAHHIWGALTVNESSYSGTGATRINNAINDVNASGGGTVLINAGTYSGNITLRSNVRIKANGGTVNLNGWIRTPFSNRATLTPTATLANGARTLSVSSTSGVSVGDIIRVRGQEGADLDTPATLRYDRAYNTAAQSNDPARPDGQVFEVESLDSTSLTFTGTGWTYPSITAANMVVERIVTRTDWSAIEGDIRAVASDGSSTVGIIMMSYARHFRLIGASAENTSDGGQSLVISNDNIYGQMRSCSGTCIAQVTSSNIDGLQMGTSTDVVAKDCAAFGGRHGVDFTGKPGRNAAGSAYSALQGFPMLRGEFHNTTWTNSVAGAGKASALGAHGISKNCMVWNCTSNWGGPTPTGIEHDFRWIVCGRADQVVGDLIINDGADGSYLRDTHIIRPGFWFRATEVTQSIDRCHFENVTYSAAPTGASHDQVEYGTGAAVNTYSNVDGPSASWTAV